MSWQCPGKPICEYDACENKSVFCLNCGLDEKEVREKERQYYANQRGESQSGNSKPRKTIASPPPQRSLPIARLGAIAIFALLLGGGVFFWQKSRACPLGQVREGKVCLTVIKPSEPERISSGERTLFRHKGNLNRDRGIDEFKAGNYPEAIEFLEKAVLGARNDPEPQIYLNNAKARRKGSPLTLAAVVPADNRATSAEEILRGLADAQQQFNDSRSRGDRLLEIAIVNDGNDPQVAAEVAAELAQNPAILAVIGHNSSDATIAALPIYEKEGLPVISPTSTSTDLGSSVFFRTVTSDRATGEKLAEFTQKDFQRIAIFYDTQSIYSQSLLKAFKSVFPASGILEEIDLRQAQLDPRGAVEKSADGEAEALILLPSTDTASIALEIAVENHNLPSRKMKLLGGDALYSPDTLINGRDAVQGLILAVPWVSQSYDPTAYSAQAEKHWGGKISWRNATSYDAARAIASVLNNRSDRQQILADLQTLELDREETSGVMLKFSPTGELDREPFLVIADPDAPPPEGAKLGFKWLP
ncbi:ABC transporter substrate-binding protein [Spirulina sp. 06S082]|uniref:ABC transporter substrate-binding protein n=1 Tax=Spirulina sp. 06S082 TaxID=3110248 RepID=UPI002B1EF0E1|nr:ABC transporter substrate-binding protein [Spirulina sp. 06S082]MEA5468419.1 ABC transporter substrate-binding protein [Spirulina sp. 06S082]